MHPSQVGYRRYSRNIRRVASVAQRRRMASAIRTTAALQWQSGRNSYICERETAEHAIRYITEQENYSSIFVGTLAPVEVRYLYDSLPSAEMSRLTRASRRGLASVLRTRQHRVAARRNSFIFGVRRRCAPRAGPRCRARRSPRGRTAAGGVGERSREAEPAYARSARDARRRAHGDLGLSPFSAGGGKYRFAASHGGAPRSSGRCGRHAVQRPRLYGAMHRSLGHAPAARSPARSPGRIAGIHRRDELEARPGRCTGARWRREIHHLCRSSIG